MSTFNGTPVPSPYETGSQSPLDSKGFFNDAADMQNVSNNRPLKWYENMPATNMGNGKKYTWKESQTGLLTNSYQYPDNVVSFGVTYSLREFNWVEEVSEAIFNPDNLSDDLAMKNPTGLIPAGTTIGDLKTNPLYSKNDNIIARMLLEEELASISVNPSVSLENEDTDDVEVGTVVPQNINIILNKGTIINGDGTTAGPVIGDLEHVSVLNPLDVEVYLNETPASNNVNAILPGYKTIKGNNTWKVNCRNEVGTTTYESLLEDDSTIASIETEKARTTRPTVNINVPAFYRAWFHLGSESSSPSTSATVRALASNILLDANNNGTYTIVVPPGPANAEAAIYCPTGKTITVIDTANLGLDVSDEFTLVQMNVEDNGATNRVYDKHVRFVGSIGYTRATTLIVTIS